MPRGRKYPAGQVRVPLHYTMTVEELHLTEKLQRRLRELDPTKLPPSRSVVLAYGVRAGLGLVPSLEEMKEQGLTVEDVG